MKPLTIALGTAWLVPLLAGLPAISYGTPILEPAVWYAPTALGQRPSDNTMTAWSYRAIIDKTQSVYTFDAPYLPIFVIGEPAPEPPPPVRAAISGSFDLDLRTYTWVTDTAGGALSEPVIEHWLFLTGASIGLSNPDYLLSLPSSVFQVGSDGSFGWSLGNCPAYPHAPWAPGYYESCTIWSNYSAGLSGTASESGFAIYGWQSSGPFGSSQSYNIVADLVPGSGVPINETPSVPIPGTVPLVLAGWLLIRRQGSNATW